MNADEYYNLCDPKEWELERVTGSRAVCKGPCYISLIVCEPANPANQLEVNVYDGENDTGKLKLAIDTKTGFPVVPFPVPAFFRRGLYIALTTNATSVSVQYMPMRD